MLLFINRYMHPETIDLIYFSEDERVVRWKHGKTYYAVKKPAALCELLHTYIAQSVSNWVLFWDYALGEPDTLLLEQLIQKPIDCWHAGLKTGAKGLPDVLNYVHPTWMYNADAPDNVTHTSFRLSFRACLLRVEVIRQLGFYFERYLSLDMAGVAYGYQLLKQGAVIRYHADMVQKDYSDRILAPLQDEWIFAKQYFPLRWQIWSAFNKRGFADNIRYWLSISGIQPVSTRPKLHSSLQQDTPVAYKTVSVLAPTLDRYPYLEEELRELNEQTILPHEVLITDQTDKDKRQKIHTEKYPSLTIKYYPQDEKGQCLAWNKLIEESTGEYIFFFGDDAYDIKTTLIEKMLQTMQRFDADMVASNVREKGIVYGEPNYHYYVSDTFPITLIKKSVVENAGGMDMFFNKNVKADHDLAMRCHMNGALMIFDPSAEIGHHRAPSGGLRTHNARTITNFMTKNSITKILNPSTSEIFIFNKYYSKHQFINHVRVKYFNQLIINGNIFKKLARLGYFIYKIPWMKKAYRGNMHITMQEFDKRGIKPGE